MKVDLVIATFNRADQLNETLENVLSYKNDINKIYVINNNSSDHTTAVLRKFSSEEVICINNECNLGAAGGKNVGLRKSDAEIIIVLDDDAIFCSEDPIKSVRKQFQQISGLGIIQFKIINYELNKILKYEFPGNNPEIMGNESFEIGYYIGAGHAIRKSMLENVGYYPDDFGLYAHEEIDLSYRAVNAGYIMRYTPEVSVYHKKAPGGRISRREVIYNMFYNRLVMTYKYLPLPYSLINNLLWFIKTSIDARNPLVAIEAVGGFLQKKSSIRRSLLNADAIDYLRKTHGRLFK